MDRRAIVWCALAMSLVVMGLAPQSARAQADYRTVVIFGDTQTAINGDPDQYSDFSAMVNWVIANKHTENIDLVMHVGDIVNLGSFLPVPPSCSGQPAVSMGYCLSQPICSPAPAGCYAAPAGGGGTDCISCSFPTTYTPPEWERFVDQWSRFDPDPAVGWLGIPTAIVRGNHDNVGVDPSTELDVRGFNYYYSEANLEALETAFAGSDRYYEHLETYPNENQDGHAWRFRIGDRPVLVVGPSYEGGFGTSQQQIDWAIDVFGQYPNMPGILLIHDMMQYSQVYHEIVREAPTVAPQLFLGAQGHIVQDMKFIDEFEGQKILRTVSDWSRTPSPGGAYLTLIRFYFEPGQPDEIEAFTYSPVLDIVVPDADKTIVRQEFPVPEPSAWSLQAFGVGAMAWFERWRRRLTRED